MRPTLIVRLMNRPVLLSVAFCVCFFLSRAYSHEDTFEVDVRYVRQIGPLLSTAQQFAGPFGVSLSKRNRLWIADDLGHSVILFDNDGKVVREFNCHGQAPGCFSYVDAVIEGPGGLLYVADTGNNRVQLLNPDGTAKGMIKRWNLYSMGLSNPRDVALDGDGGLFVADWGNHCIRNFSIEGEYRSSIGSRGQGQGQFEHPIAIAFDDNGNLYVSDFGNHRIQKFDSSGEFIKIIGQQGTRVGEFINPAGIAFDQNGWLYIVDRGNSRIQVFDQNDRPITSFGKLGSDPLEFKHPTDIATSEDGLLYVVDQGNQRVLVYEVETDPNLSQEAPSKNERDSIKPKSTMENLLYRQEDPSHSDSSN
ncbi:NHL repeat-containing protein [Thiorhodovibrio winogradskyi]|nr:NHL repeat-containing protein [Thiorhodovibrio winogradskyi]